MIYFYYINQFLKRFKNTNQFNIKTIYNFLYYILYNKIFKYNKFLINILKY